MFCVYMMSETNFPSGTVKITGLEEKLLHSETMEAGGVYN